MEQMYRREKKRKTAGRYCSLSRRTSDRETKQYCGNSRGIALISDFKLPDILKTQEPQANI